MGALDFLSEVWAGEGTIIILELSSRSTFLLCFIHSWSPVKLWIRAVKSLALLEGMEKESEDREASQAQGSSHLSFALPKAVFLWASGQAGSLL